MKKQEESDIHHNDDVYNLDIYSARKQNCTTGQWKISCLTSKSNLPLKTTLKIPSEMEVAPPHKRFTQFSTLIKL